MKQIGLSNEGKHSRVESSESRLLDFWPLISSRTKNVKVEEALGESGTGKYHEAPQFLYECMTEITSNLANISNEG